MPSMKAWAVVDEKNKKIVYWDSERERGLAIDTSKTIVKDQEKNKCQECKRGYNHTMKQVTISWK